MKLGIVIWATAFATSLGLHAVLAVAVSGLSEATQPAQQLKLFVGEEFSFVSTTLTPSAIEASSVLRVSPHVNYGERQSSVVANVLQPTQSVNALLAVARPPQPALAPVVSQQLEPLDEVGEGITDGLIPDGNGSTMAPVAAEPEPAKRADEKSVTPERTGTTSYPPVIGAGSKAVVTNSNVISALPSGQNSLEAIPSANAPVLRPSKVTGGSSTADPLRRSEQGHALVPADAAEQSLDSSVIVRPVEAQEAPKTVAQELAFLQPVPVSPATVNLNSLQEKIVELVRNYNGGPCFVAVPVKGEGVNLAIVSFSSHDEPMLQLRRAIRFNLGADVEVGARKVTDGQCPVLGFIDTLLKSRIPELKVSLSKPSIADGSNVAGLVSGIELPWINLLLVDDDGMVHDISSYGTMVGADLRFSAPVIVTAMGKSRNQLVVAIAAGKELPLLSLSEPVSGANLFASVLREASEQNTELAIGLGAFRVE